MSEIIVAGRVNNPFAPQPVPFGQQLLTQTWLRGWFRPAIEDVTLNGATSNIVSLNNRKPGSASKISQATDLDRPTLEPKQISVFPAAQFDGAPVVMSYVGSAGYWVGTWSMAIMFRIDPSASADMILFSSFNSSTQQTRLFYDQASGSIVIWHGSNAYPLGAAKPGQWQTAIVSNIGAGHVIKGQLDTGAIVSGGTDNNGGTLDMVIGAQGSSGGTAAFVGEICDIFDATTDLLDPANAAQLALVQGYIRSTYQLHLGT